MSETREIEYSNDNGRTWSICECIRGSIVWHVGNQPVSDGFGNWYRAKGSTIEVPS